MKKIWEYIKITFAIVGLLIALVIALSIYTAFVGNQESSFDTLPQNEDGATSTFIEVDTDKFVN